MTNPTIELRVTMDPGGSVQVTGPVDNKMACYAMLEMARDAIHDHHAAKANKIVPATNGDVLSIARR